MHTDNDNADMVLEFNENLIDTSISDAKWLLGCVAALGLFVIGLGMLASTLAV